MRDSLPAHPSTFNRLRRLVFVQMFLSLVNSQEVFESTESAGDQRQLNRAFSACLYGDLNSWGAAPGLILR